MNEPDRPQGYLDPRHVEVLFDHEDANTLPPEPPASLVLPKLTRGTGWWPKLGLYFLKGSKPHGRPPLELVSLEIVLVPTIEQQNSHERRRCVAFRFEPPTCFSSGQPATGDHDYYHMQFVSAPRSKRGAGVDDDCLPLPDQFPAFPVRARDFGSLVLALAVALYGRTLVEARGNRGVELDLSPETRRLLSDAYLALGYSTWD